MGSGFLGGFFEVAGGRSSIASVALRYASVMAMVRSVCSTANLDWLLGHDWSTRWAVDRTGQDRLGQDKNFAGVVRVLCWCQVYS